MRHRSVSQTFSLPLDLVERIAVVCERLRINRSVIARQAIEKELEGYGGGTVRKVSDSVFAGAAGALKLAMAMPEHKWNHIKELGDMLPAA